MKPLAGVLLRLEGSGDAGVAAQVAELRLVEVVEGRHDELVAVEAGPRERDARRPVRVDGDDVTERPRLEEVSHRPGDGHGASLRHDRARPAHRRRVGYRGAHRPETA